MVKSTKNSISTDDIFISFAQDETTQRDKIYKDNKCYRSVISYILGISNPEKNVRYKGGYGVDYTNVDNAVMQFKIVSKLPKKNQAYTRRLYHFYIKFFSKDFDPNQAYIIGENISEFIYKNGYQNIYAVHEDTTFCHIHFVFNSRNYIHGLQYHANKHERDCFFYTIKSIAVK